MRPPVPRLTLQPEGVPALPDLLCYDTIIIAFSGGKDSVACLLRLLQLGVPRERIELWHQEIDGREGSHLMDWECTLAYCCAVAQAFGIPIYFQWKVGGFEREMCRADAPTAPTRFELPDGTVGQAGGQSKKRGTRQLFPQVSASLTTRWCSAYLKIDVCAMAIRNQGRFNGRRTMVVTGERAEESASRAKYAPFEVHKADPQHGKPYARQWPSSRHVDQWRPLHDWSEEQVWGIMRRYRLLPHPAYWLGYGRVSCRHCIFGNPNQWATNQLIDPEGTQRIIDYETCWGKTIHRSRSVPEQIARGTPYPAAVGLNALFWRSVATRPDWTLPIIVEEGEWQLPPGAFVDGCGPS